MRAGEALAQITKAAQTATHAPVRECLSVETSAIMKHVTPFTLFICFAILSSSLSVVADEYRDITSFVYEGREVDIVVNKLSYKEAGSKITNDNKVSDYPFSLSPDKAISIAVQHLRTATSKADRFDDFRLTEVKLERFFVSGYQFCYVLAFESGESGSFKLGVSMHGLVLPMRDVKSGRIITVADLIFWTGR